MTKATQQERILAYLRKHKVATNRALIINCDVMCPWKRLRECTSADGYVWCAMGSGWMEVTDERITRHFIKTKGGARVVQYRLETVR